MIFKDFEQLVNDGFFEVKLTVQGLVMLKLFSGNNEVTEVAQEEGFVSTDKGRIAASHISDAVQSFPITVPTQEEIG